LQRVVTQAQLDRYFTVWVSSAELLAGKPAPDVYQEAARRLGVMPKHCIVIEDAIAGIEAGKRAGCHTVLLDRNSTYTPDVDNTFHPDRVVSSVVGLIS